MSHTWMSYVTHVNDSCHTYEWVLSRMRMSHVTHIRESCHTYEWVLLQVPRPLHFCSRYKSWMSHPNMNESHCNTLQHTATRCNTLSLFLLQVTSDTWIKPCHTYECVMSYIWMSHVTHMNESCHTYEWATPQIRIRHVTHMNESYYTDE